ncbi:MAG: MFS transporter [Solirubrobacterales bacterium]|nr:MFS transporter [Solirubrobacterales bacterium]
MNTSESSKTKGKWIPVIVLAIAQFIMVLDTTVMNVSISAVVEDLNTTISGVQLAITSYALVMGAFMMTGGRLGDILGRRKAFAIGLMIYGTGSLITALSPNLPVLLLGWSLVEGLGATLVMPAIMALTAAMYTGKDRAVAYGLLGGIAGAGAAAGPLIGGYVTTTFSWRYVFAAETVIVIGLLAVGLRKLVNEKPAGGRLSAVDIVLTASGMSAIVLGILKASTWGFVTPTNPPVISGHTITPLGLSPTPFVVGLGIAILALYLRRARRIEEGGGESLLRPSLLRIEQLRSGLTMLGATQLVLGGMFFILPVFLQVTLNKNALDTGIAILPLSLAMIVAALAGPRIATKHSPRLTVRLGLVVLSAGLMTLVGKITSDFESAPFAVGMAIAGAGLGLIMSQLGNVIMSSVDEKSTGEAGGLQGTAQNLGMALGTALIGGILLSSLTTGFQNQVAADPSLPQSVKVMAQENTKAGVQVVSQQEAVQAAEQAGLPPNQVETVSAHYMDAQVDGLRLSLAVVAILALLSLLLTRGLPSRPAGEINVARVEPALE